MNRSITSLLLSLLALVLLFAACASRPEIAPEFYFNTDQALASSNRADESAPSAASADDYYFIVIADTQNLVRSNDFNRYNLMAKQIMTASHNGKGVFNRIRFIVHNGDNVYNGVDAEQWHNLKMAFSKTDYLENNTPYLKMLATEKPFFPVLGNHDVMKLQLRPQTEYRDMAGSAQGLKYFKDFYNWGKLMSDGRVIKAIPSQLSLPMFNDYLNRLPDTDSKERFRSLYQKKGNLVLLQFYQDLIAKIEADPDPDVNQYEKRFEDRQAAVISEAMDLYDRLGIKTLPAIASDQMICYGLESGGMYYLMLDSMARGWHYPEFSRLKHGLYRKKMDQHRLNLFSPSPFNGQYAFVKAFLGEVRSKNGRIAVFMHHSALNSVNSIDATGLEYNLRLIMGLDREQTGDSFWDELLFSRGTDPARSPLVQHIFSACVHYLQQFRLERMEGSEALDDLHWHISGGGGGALEVSHDDSRLHRSIQLWNTVLEEKAPGRSVRLADNQVVINYNLLLVHVKSGVVADVVPITPRRDAIELKNPRFFHVRARWNVGWLSRPLSMIQFFSVSLFSIGMEWLSDFLQFITLDPSIGIGFMYYNGDGGRPDELQEYVGTFEFSPLDFRLRFPGEKELTLMLPGILFISGEGTHAKSYLTSGIQLPLFHHLFGRYKALQVGFKHLIPLKLVPDHDPVFGKDLRWMFFANYTF